MCVHILFFSDSVVCFIIQLHPNILMKYISLCFDKSILISYILHSKTVYYIQQLDDVILISYNYFDGIKYVRRLSTCGTRIMNDGRNLNLNAELNPICHLLALLGAHHILHVGRIWVKLRLSSKSQKNIMKYK